MRYEEAKQFLKPGMKVKTDYFSADFLVVQPGLRDGLRTYDNGLTFDGTLPLHFGNLEILTEADGVTPWKDPRVEEKPKRRLFTRKIEEFKVGDKVRVYRCLENPDTKLIGTEFTITSIDSNVARSGDSRIGGWSFHNLEKVQTSTTSTTTNTTLAYDPAVPPYCDELSYFSQAELINKIDKHISGRWETSKPAKGIIMNAVETIKKLALKATNPNEYELREAGLHDSNGEITSEGSDLVDTFVYEFFMDKLVEAAKAINAEKNKK